MSLILGLETSCDDTAAALYDGRRIVAEVISTQLEHREWGGVVPEIASRAHLRNIVPVVDACLDQASASVNNISTVAVTAGPGLAGTLLVGLNFARGLSDSLNIPFLGINHLQAHIWAAEIESVPLDTPFICLIVSGGHTSLIKVDSAQHYATLGQTLDDAAGEVLDKIGRLQGLTYPAGAEIDKIAAFGNPDSIKFPRGMSASGDLNFSFSGLKTAARIFLDKNPEYLTGAKRTDFLASLQEAVIDILVTKSLKALESAHIDNLVLGGGVSANSRLRKKFQTVQGLNLRIPAPKRSTDNGAMVAHLAWKLLQNGYKPPGHISAKPDWTIENMCE